MATRKKSQMSVSQIFIYILTLFIAAFILFFGYQSIAGLREKGKEADYLQFKSEIEAAVKLSKGYGDASNEVLVVPEGYTKVCFVSYYPQTVDADSSFPASFSPVIPIPLIKNSVDDGIKKNVFLVKNDNEADSFFVDNIKVSAGLEPGAGDDNFGCITAIAGRLKIKFEGEGDKTLISTY